MVNFAFAALNDTRGELTGMHGVKWAQFYTIDLSIFYIRSPAHDD